MQRLISYSPYTQTCMLLEYLLLRCVSSYCDISVLHLLLTILQILVGRLPLNPKSPASNTTYIMLAHGRMVLLRPKDDGERVTDALWEMMKECWVKESANRPSAGALYKRIKNPAS